MNGTNDDGPSTPRGSGRSGSVSQGAPTILVPGSIYNGRVLGATIQGGYIKLGPGPEEKLAIATGSSHSIVDVGTIECWVRLDGQPDSGEPRELVSIAEDSEIGPSLTISIAGDHGSIVVGDDLIDYPFGPEFHHLVFLLRSGMAYAFSRRFGAFEPVYAEDGVGASVGSPRVRWPGFPSARLLDPRRAALGHRAHPGADDRVGSAIQRCGRLPDAGDAAGNRS